MNEWNIHSIYVAFIHSFGGIHKPWYDTNVVENQEHTKLKKRNINKSIFIKTNNNIYIIII